MFNLPSHNFDANHHRLITELVVVGVVKVGQVDHDRGMRLSSPAISKSALKVNAAVKAEGPIWQQINVQSLVIRRSIDDPNVACLQEVIGYDKMLLVKREFNVVRTNRWLILVRVVEALHVVEVADIERCDVVCRGQSDWNEHRRVSLSIYFEL